MGVFSTTTDIANLALGFLNQKPISDFSESDPSDNSLTTLQFYYPIALEQVIRDVKMELTSKFVQLVKLVDNPTKEWLYAYYLPTEAAKFKRIFSGIYPDSLETEVPHRKVPVNAGAAVDVAGVTQADPAVVTADGLEDGQVVKFASVGGMVELNGNSYIVDEAAATTCQLLDLATGEAIDSTDFTAYTTGGTVTPQAHQRILTNIEECWVEYSIIPDLSLWPADFGIAVGYKLAMLSGVRILGIEHKDFVEGLKVDYVMAKNNAMANGANESFKGVRPLSASTLSRMSRRGVRRPSC
ncbi:MAG TPA: hypothetical protein VHE12_05810 [bacterium]|nr:hypothetical protein [bacterium]